MRIYLVGYMGSGKSKTAEALSRIFKYDYADTDHLVEKKNGKTITVIFEEEGQEHFRDLERDVLRTTVKKENLIVSTGGGTPCYHDNMQWMNENGITVYLEANPGLLFHRLATTRENRPLLNGLGDVELSEQIMGHLAVRIPFYRKAQITVGAADMNVKLLAEKIRENVNSK